MKNFFIKDLSLNDLAELIEIELATQISPWSEEIFVRCFNAGSVGWGIEEEGRLVGSILVLIQVGEAHILNLCVRPESQHQGIGQQLLMHALTHAKKQEAGMAYLEVRISNRKAINLYKKMGFIEVGERPNYYCTSDGRENALIFVKDLQLS